MIRGAGGSCLWCQSSSEGSVREVGMLQPRSEIAGRKRAALPVLTLFSEVTVPVTAIENSVGAE